MSNQRSVANRIALGAAATAAVVGASLLLRRFMQSRRIAAASSAQAAASQRPYDVLLFDVEGTTTPISFVKETLFPYVTANVSSYLRAHYSEPETRADIQALIELSEADAAAGVEGVVSIPRFEEQMDEAQVQQQIDAAVANVAWQMSSDRKSTALKQLQGHMWLGGYESGELKGALFGGESGDVVHWLREWHSQGYKLGIYSSGSVAAQKLLFRHSDAGDLTPLLSCHFDTKVGMKQESDSYARIAKELGVEPSRILFFTDVYGEAWAACTAGVDSVLLTRPGNAPLPADQQSKHAFPLANDFHEADALIQRRATMGADAGSAVNCACKKNAQACAGGAKAQVDTSSGAFNTF